MAQKLIKFETIDRSDDIAMKSDIDPQMGIFEAERVANERIRVDNEEDRVEAEGLREAAKEATIEATRLANISTIDSNTAAILANTKAGLASTKAALADSAATNANNKAGLAVTATTNANNAAALANTKAGIAQTAADNANDAADYAQEQGNLASDINATARSNEAARIDAESARATNEIARVNSNNLMENAEAWRINREDQRGINELDRATAEVLREQAKADTIEATENANTATGLTIAAKDDYYNVVKPEIISQGEYATAQGDYAKAQGEAIQDDLGLKLDKTAVKQNTGTSETDVMSQKSVTDEIAKRSGLIYEYVHSDNIEISGFTVDLTTGTFTKASHGLSNGDELRTCLNQNITTLFLKDVTFAEYIVTASMIRYVVNATANTFQLSRTKVGAVEALTAVAGTDLTKWHFEKRTSVGLFDILSLGGINALSGNSKNIRVVVTGKIATNTGGGHLYFNIDDIVTDTRYIAYLGSGAASLRATYSLLRADGFGTIEYDCTYNGNNLVIRKNLLMIKEQNLNAYAENQLFYKNNTTYTLNKVIFDINGFTNGLTIQIYKQ